MIFLLLLGITYIITSNICLQTSFIAIARDTARACTRKSPLSHTTAIRNIVTLYCNMASIFRTSLGESRQSPWCHHWMPGKEPERVLYKTLACWWTLQILERNKDSSMWKMIKLSLSMHCHMGRFNDIYNNNLLMILHLQLCRWIMIVHMLDLPLLLPNLMTCYLLSCLGINLEILAFMGLSLLVLMAAAQTLLRAQTTWITLTLPP